MSQLLERLGRFSVRRRRYVLGAWIALLVGLIVLGGALGGKGIDNFTVPGAESQKANDALAERFPDKAGMEERIVVRAPKGAKLTDPEVRDEVQGMLDRVARQPHVAKVDKLTVSPQVPAIGFTSVSYRPSAEGHRVDAGDRLVAEATPLRDQGYQVEFGGELKVDAEKIGGSSEMIGLLVAVVVLLIAFGSVVAMGLPLGTALIGLGTGLSVITVAEAFIDVPTVSPTLATMIGLGVGIDYALFIVTRHREHLHQGESVEDSAARALATAGQAVVFAGITVVIAICGLQFAGVPVMATMGYATAVVVLISVAAAITLLPAFLGFAGTNIDKLKVPGVKAAAAGDENSVASRWSRHVSDHPWRYLLLSLAFLGTLIIPFFSIRLGQADDGNAPPGSTRREAFDLLAEGFGPGFNGPLAIVVEKGDGPFDASIATLVTAIGKDPEVVFVVPKATVNPAGDTAIVTVFPKHSPQDAGTQELVHRLRHDVLPRAAVEAGVDRPLVTGRTAVFIDISEKITARLPPFIGGVLLMSFILLMIVFRSILVPLKAGLMNLLGIGAAYGVVVAVFQWQWGGRLLGVEEALPISSFLPMFMFAILFGLSMDYEVFLMSRVREEYLRTGDNTASVSAGISHTARVITAAAIIMVSVFGAFAFGEDPTVKMMGIGLATAIFIDATVIRMVLVPASMRLLGDRNWWLPGWLDRILPHLDLEGESAIVADGTALADREPEPVG